MNFNVLCYESTPASQYVYAYAYVWVSACICLYVDGCVDWVREWASEWGNVREFVFDFTVEKNSQ